MSIEIKKLERNQINEVREIWNEVVEDGIAFPQLEILCEESAVEFFFSQTFTGVAIDTVTNKIQGLYILHPNNVGRCGHIANASFAVSSNTRGMGIGESLVSHCIAQGKNEGFKILQFNAVVASNYGALHLYEKLGFTKLGTIPKGFLLKNGEYEDIIPHYIEL